MDAVSLFLYNNGARVGLTVGVLGISVVVLRKLLAKRTKQRRCGVDYPADTVIVHQLGKGDFVPSLGHFVMKFETYLRINKIPYQPVYGKDFGPKRKIPWIEYNGVTMGDSHLIIQFLNKEFNVDLNKSLDKDQRAMAWAIQKWLEEFIYHLNVYTRWCLLSAEMGKCAPSIPKYALYLYKYLGGKAEWTIGTARHTKQEVHGMMVFNLRQFATILGDKDFVMGGDGPTEVDCAAFGVLSQVRWCTPDSCPGKQVLEGELHNVVSYLERMKEQYWPDWQEQIVRGKTKD